MIRDRLSIVEVISRYLMLKKCGREWVGVCPFHADKNPSLCVNEEKGVFYCHGCHEGGDVFNFIMKLEHVTFTQAVKSLDVDSICIPERRNPNPIKQRASWLNDQYLKVGFLLRELSKKIALAKQTPDIKLAESLSRQWEILSDLQEDLQNLTYAEELFEAQDSIEAITSLVVPEPLPVFPELTPQYREYLKAAVKGELY